MLSDQQIRERLGTLQAVFVPASPIQSDDLFAGRQDQVVRLVECVDDVGRHAALYGERGVGKTSLANIVSSFRLQGTLTIKTACDSADHFPSIWKRLLDQVPLTVRQRMGFVRRDAVEVPLGSALPATDFTPGNLTTVLRQLPRCLFVVDEYDRVVSAAAKQLMSELLKSLSDAGAAATVLLVGVAGDVSRLVGSHASVERCMMQVHLPRMGHDELQVIIERGFDRLQMSPSQDVIAEICRIADGFPHYVHLLGKCSAKAALLRREQTVRPEHLRAAMNEALQDTQESIREAYQRATMSTQRNQFREILLAAARCPVDEHGTFRASDLVSPMSAILGKPCTVASVFSPLTSLCSKDRGPVFARVGGKRRPRYRFVNPLMKPYLLLRASAAGE